MNIHLLILIVLIVLTLLWARNFLQVKTSESEPRHVIVGPIKLEAGCTSPPVTGRLKVTTQDMNGDSNCVIRLGDIYEPLIGQPFSATWNDSKVPNGGYIFSWGPTGLFYGLNKARMFLENITVVTQQQFESDGNGFSISRGGVIPCDCCGVQKMQTPFYVSPVRNLTRIRIFSSFRFENEINVKYQNEGNFDTYLVLVEIKRDSTLKVMSGVPNVAYHGTMTSKLKAQIILPSYDWTSELDFGQYASTFDVKIFGFNLCDAGNSTSVRAGNLASFI